MKITFLHLSGINYNNVELLHRHCQLFHLNMVFVKGRQTKYLQSVCAVKVAELAPLPRLFSPYTLKV